MKFELNKKEEESLQEMINAVKVLFDEKVEYKVTYCFSTGSGIGDSVDIIIESKQKGLFSFKKDITDYGSW